MQEQVQDHLLRTTIDGRYLVRSRLAGGGMSTVYLATDRRLEREVALKVLHPHLASDQTFLRRLSQEAKAAASLSHPHVVGVLDQGQEGHTAYLVMEYVKGHTLRDVLLQQGALTPRLALALADPVIEGIAAAHSAGLIHRDIKPENVLIADDGRIKVGDFGLARAATSATSTGSLIGTVAYLAPELVMGQAADARSDVYSVGIMLYELLTGGQPYRGEVPIQVAYQHVNSVVPAPSREVPGLAPDLDELVQWCTAKEPENRPVDGAALLDELRHIRTTLSDAQLDERPPSAKPLRGAPAPAGSMHATETLPAAAARGQAAETPATPAFPTEIIPNQHNATTILQSPAQMPIDGNGPLPGKRGQKRLQRQEEKDRARAAATPVRSLREGNPRRRGLLWVIIVVVLALLATSAGLFFGLGPGSAATVPEVKNKTVAEAQALLRTAGFQSEPRDIFDNDVKAGLAVGTEPASGLTVRKFQPISLLVSKGAQLFPLANMGGMPLEEAKSTLNSARMALGTVTEAYDEKVPAGAVVSQEPAAGTAIKQGTAVALVVSKGPQPIPVPDVRGRKKDDAVTALKDAGLAPVTAPATVYDRKIPKGSVVSQVPADGVLTRGGTVTLTISEGPKMVKVPSFVGKQAKAAEEALRNLGFEVTINNVLGGFFGTVRDQNPVDKEVPEGTTITLTVV